MPLNYPSYVVDMFYDYLKAEDADAYDPNKCEEMLMMVEFEVELYELENGITSIDDRDVGWYCDLMRQVQDKYGYTADVL
jgi:hypothetical protein